ncbi:outer membrane protein assembly factor BamB [Acidiferrobacter sp.]|uniref:outer membrane protein assembly factor BamB n=1 Tax=Acidiferrobacter sp. TaxID=1872107 RepID=UPI0026097200|nr:outer membrane protein assembly factor BamB [Acidiferrobacter sp.]
MRRLLGILVAAGLLGGCALFGSNRNVAPPAKLKPFRAQLKVSRIWSHDTGNGTGGYDLVLRPARIGDTIFVANENGAVVAYRARDGHRLWRHHLKARITAGVGAGRGLVVVATRRGRVLALHAGTGALAWTAQAPSEVLAAPVVASHGVYVASLDGHVTAFGLGHGRRLWMASHTHPALTLFLTARPAHAAGVLYEGYANGELVALRADNGERLWTSAVAQPRGGDAVERLIDLARPLYAQNIVYVNGYHGAVVAVGTHSGRILWGRPMSSYRSMALGGQSLYVVTAHSRVMALANASGGTVWKQKLFLNRRLGSPALAGPAVVLGDLAGYTQWLSRRTGQPVARKRIGEGAIRAAPLVARVGGRKGRPYVFVLTTTGRLAALTFRPIRP